MRVWRETKSCPRGGEESQGSTATARRRREESIFDRSGEASCRPYPPVPHAGPEGAGAAAFFLKSAPAFLARTRWDSETGPTFCCALTSLANSQSEGCGRGSGLASCHDPVEEENRSEADQHNCERGKSGLLVTIERHERKDLGGKRVKVEGPEQKRCRQLLHRIDEDEERRGAERGPEQGQMHFEQHLAQARAKRTRRGIDIARHPRQARLDRAERGGKEANGVGEHNGERGSRKEQSRRDSEQGPHGSVDEIVEAREWDEEPDCEHGSRYGVADRGDRARAPNQLRARLPPRIGEHHGEADRNARSRAREQEAVQRGAPERGR